MKMLMDLAAADPEKNIERLTLRLRGCLLAAWTDLARFSNTLAGGSTRCINFTSS